MVLEIWVHYSNLPNCQNNVFLNKKNYFSFTVHVILTESKHARYSVHNSMYLLQNLFYRQLVSCVVLRNLSEQFQQHVSQVLCQLGSFSLWLFISSLHILLSMNGTSLLLLFPFLPGLLNFPLVLSVFLFSHHLFATAQLTFCQHFFPHSCH